MREDLLLEKQSDIIHKDLLFYCTAQGTILNILYKEIEFEIYIYVCV